MFGSIIAFLIILLAIGLSGVKIFKEYQRGVVFRLGRLVSFRGPGLSFVIPFVEKMVRVDLRTVTMTVSPQDVITRDNVSVKVAAVVYFRVVDPNSAITQIENYLFGTSQLAQTTLRSVCGQAELDEILSQRERIITGSINVAHFRPHIGPRLYGSSFSLSVVDAVCSGGSAAHFL